MSRKLAPLRADDAYRAERRMGELTAAMPKAQGKRAELLREPVEVSRTQQLRDAGIHNTVASECEQLAAMPDDRQPTLPGFD